jgi:hypothetical protein
MRLRTMMIGIAAVLGALCWTAVPDVAYAGGPTSVLVVNLDGQQATGLYHTDTGYDRLVASLDAYGTAAGSADRPRSISGDAGETLRLTWLIHDQQIWRIDRIHLTASDGVWVQTVSDLNGSGDPFDGPGSWHRPADARDLLAVLAAVPASPGPVISESAIAAAELPAASQVEPLTSGLHLAGAGLIGLILGVGGTLLARRVRPTRREGLVLEG